MSEVFHPHTIGHPVTTNCLYYHTGSHEAWEARQGRASDKRDFLVWYPDLERDDIPNPSRFIRVSDYRNPRFEQGGDAPKGAGKLCEGGE